MSLIIATGVVMLLKLIPFSAKYMPVIQAKVLVRDNNIISTHFFTYSTGMALINYVEEHFPEAHICISGKDRAP